MIAKSEVADVGAVVPPQRPDALPAGRSLMDRYSELRRRRGYDLAVRFLGSLWFLFLAAFVAKGTFLDPRMAQLASSYEYWPILISRSCLAAFYIVLWILLVARPPAVAQSDGL